MLTLNKKWALQRETCKLGKKYMKIDFAIEIFSDKYRATFLHGNSWPTGHKRQQRGSGVMFGASIEVIKIIYILKVDYSIMCRKLL